jgi:two-component system, OmpR family, sensor histidine kinase KdpD
VDRRERRGLEPLEGEAQRRLERNLSLARELGAEVVVTHDDDVADALVRVALQNNATQIVVGKSRSPAGSTSAGRQPGRPAPADRRASIDIYVVPAERAAGKPEHVDRLAPRRPRPRASTGRSLGPRRADRRELVHVVPHSGYLPWGLFYLLR